MINAALLCLKIILDMDVFQDRNLFLNLKELEYLTSEK